MMVRETIECLIEEERQFPHRTGAHLAACASWLHDLYELLDDVSRDPMSEHAEAACALLARSVEPEEKHA